MVLGRDKESVFAFFRSIGKEWCERVEVVTADLWPTCMASGLEPFVKFGKRLKRCEESILAHFTYKITNAIAEGINNVIKVVKRTSFGFHDFEYFRLKVLARTGQLRPFPFVGWHYGASGL